MGKPTGFMDYKRETSVSEAPLERIRNFNEFHTPLSKEEQQIQGARCMNCGVPFCQAGMNIMGMTSGCPLHNLVPEWNDLVYTGNWEQAYNRLKKTNNFPEFTSRVCPALCEAACTCGHWGDAVTCKENEHGIIENAYEQGYAAAKPPRVRTGKKVAVIGSGPAGLAVADQLNKRGHLVTVYERDDRVGGLLMYGIPNMKLEKWVIDRKVSIMKEEGITFVTNTNVGKDVKAAKLLKEYDRVILACGAKNPRDIKAPGRDAKGIYFAVDFLKATTKSLLDSDLKDNQYISAKGKRVVIIGGGDTGNDCVGTSIRHGAASVTQLEMMPKAPDTRAHPVPARLPVEPPDTTAPKMDPLPSEDLKMRPFALLYQIQGINIHLPLYQTLKEYQTYHMFLLALFCMSAYSFLPYVSKIHMNSFPAHSML